MKILAPLRASLEVAGLLEAGAEEFFCGVTPLGWEPRYGNAWTSRRAPQAAGVPDLDDFVRILAGSGGRPVYVTLNAPYYPPGAVEMLVKFAALLLELGAYGLIVANLELLLALVAAGHGERLQLSSLATCVNSEAAKFYRDLGISRIVLPRHLTLAEIEALAVEGVELEVFLLNDGCVFEEGLCSTTHAAGPFCLLDGEGTEGVSAETLDRYAFWKWTLSQGGCRTGNGSPLGPCGLCALPRLLKAGIASVKVVGREASLERKVAAVRIAALALALAKEGAGAERISEKVIELRGMSELCRQRHLCYYPDVWPERAAGGTAC